MELSTLQADLASILKDLLMEDLKNEDDLPCSASMHRAKAITELIKLISSSPSFSSEEQRFIDYYQYLMGDTCVPSE